MKIEVTDTELRIGSTVIRLPEDEDNRMDLLAKIAIYTADVAGWEIRSIDGDTWSPDDWERFAEPLPKTENSDVK